MKKWNDLSYTAQERIIVTLVTLAMTPVFLAMMYGCLWVGVTMAFPHGIPHH